MGRYGRQDSYGEENNPRTRGLGSDEEDTDTLSGLVRHYARKYRKVIVPTVAAVAALTIFGMSYRPVSPSNVGVVTRLGTYARTEQPGPHFIVPLLEGMTPVDVMSNNSVEIGFRTVEEAAHGKPAVYDSAASSDEMRQEAQMLTADENIAWAEVVIQYRVDPTRVTDYLFNINDPVSTIHGVGQAVTRQAVGNYGVDELLTFGRDEITQQIKLDTQKILDNYGAGVEIVGVYLQNPTPPDVAGSDSAKGTVLAAFQNVETARQNMDQAINDAKAYENKVTTEAEGRANQLIADAEGVKVTRVGLAQRDVAEFELLLGQYLLDPLGTKSRLYLETMEKIYPNLQKYIVDGNLPGNGVLPLLNLNGGN